MAVSTNRIIELCLVFFISVLSFSIGTYIGKKYADNQHRLSMLDPNHSQTTELPATAVHSEEPVQKTETASVAEASDSEIHQDGSTQAAKQAEVEQPIAPSMSHAISDEDVAKLSAEMEEEEQATPQGKPVKEIQATSTTASKKTETNIVREVASISEKAKSIGTSTNGAKYTVQVGAYPSTTEADKIVNSLKARGYSAAFTQANVNGKTWYRVQVGSFVTLEEAQAQKKDLVEKNHLSSAIIQRINK